MKMERRMSRILIAAIMMCMLVTYMPTYAFAEAEEPAVETEQLAEAQEKTEEPAEAEAPEAPEVAAAPAAETPAAEPEVSQPLAEPTKEEQTAEKKDRKSEDKEEENAAKSRETSEEQPDDTGDAPAEPATSEDAPALTQEEEEVVEQVSGKALKMAALKKAGPMMSNEDSLKLDASNGAKITDIIEEDPKTVNALIKLIGTSGDPNLFTVEHVSGDYKSAYAVGNSNKKFVYTEDNSVALNYIMVEPGEHEVDLKWRLSNDNYYLDITVLKVLNERENAVSVGYCARPSGLTNSSQGQGMLAVGFRPEGEAMTSYASYTGEGVYVLVHTDLYEKGTNEKKNLYSCYYAIDDIDAKQSYQNLTDPFTTENLYYKDKEEFDTNSTGAAFPKWLEPGTTLYNRLNEESGTVYSEYAINPNNPKQTYQFATNYQATLYQKTDKYLTNGMDVIYGFLGAAGSGMGVYQKRYTATYKSNNGTVNGDPSELIEEWDSPTRLDQTANEGYYFDKWVTDQDVTLRDGSTIGAGSTITLEQLKQIKTEGNLSFTADNKPYLNVNYKWDGDHPGQALPEGKGQLKEGETYDTDRSYKTGDTVKGEKDGVKGTWMFLGWDKSGTLTINEDTEIVGRWSFVADPLTKESVETPAKEESQKQTSQASSKLVKTLESKTSGSQTGGSSAKAYSAGDVPNTGDETEILVYGLGLAGSLALLMAMFLRRRREEA